ncbi:MAG: hypothetical protein IKR86_11435 [Candidatus Methanomethylophilaceae archaeon]|nr:hypothetical protein [Candidatus Methanomethylophilaceae archaeon]
MKLALFPEEDGKVNYYGLLYLDEYLVRNLLKEALIVTSCPGVMKVADLFTPKIRDVVILTDEEMDDLIAYLKLTEDDSRFVIVSLTKPATRNAKHLVGVKDLTVEQIVAIGIYFIIPFRQIIRSFDYSSSDHSAMEIMKEAS